MDMTGTKRSKDACGVPPSTERRRLNAVLHNTPSTKYHSVSAIRRKVWGDGLTATECKVLDDRTMRLLRALEREKLVESIVRDDGRTAFRRVVE